MDYKEKYEKLHRFVKDLYPHMSEYCKEKVEGYIPELKESENERIRKTFIRYVKDWQHGYCTWNSDKDFCEDAIAWLEKQGEIDKASYEIAEKEKREFVGDGFIKCYADFQDFKEGEIYWLEYLGNDNYNVRSDNLLGKTYHITPCQLYTIFKKQTWLEKQGETFTKKDVDDAYLKGVCDAKHELEKQGQVKGADIPQQEEKTCKENDNSLTSEQRVEEAMRELEEKAIAYMEAHKGETADEFIARCRGEQKPFDYENANIQQKDFAPKAEPKFKVGDWVASNICNSSKLLHIIDVDDNNYEVETTQENTGVFSIAYVDSHFHLWTIQDAKDGDVLYCKSDCGIEYIVMSKGVNNHNNIDSYFRYNSVDGFGIDIPNVLSAKQDNIIPATQEQRDALMKAMADAGYTFDFEKKELKKIEKKSDWSEEDENLLQGIWDEILANKHDAKEYEWITYDRFLNWLKSIKDRVQPQPKQEWSKEDERIYQSIIDDTVQENQLDSKQIDWLKSLKDRLK